MFSLDIDCTQETQELRIAELWEEGSTGIVELSATQLRAFFDDDADATHLEQRFGSHARPAADRDWIADSRNGLDPILVGERFFLVPEWRDDPTPDSRFRIEVNNGLAFGSGRHETTRLCLELLEDYVRPGMTVLDIGTGSGILAKAAKLLGAATVIGCDTDPLAIDVARASGIPMFVGSSAAMRSGAADIVVANINPEGLASMSGEWDRLLKPGGIAILSGLELQDELAVTPVTTLTEGNWKALVTEKPAPPE